MTTWNAPNFVVEVGLRRDSVPSFDQYPFDIPAIRDLDGLRLEKPVTFFVGENGSGKSTLLEAIAVAWGLNPEGGSRNFNFASRASHSGLSECLYLARSIRRARDSYFLRAETYYNVATEIERLDAEEGPGDKVTKSYGNVSLHEQSHGQSFFALFQNRFRGEGFYVLDEPEAALSPSRQLSFLAQLHELVRAGSQFVIATHSPILMAYPNATILLFGEGAPRAVAYEDTEHFAITRNFLNAPERMLRRLLADPDEE